MPLSTGVSSFFVLLFCSSDDKLFSVDELINAYEDIYGSGIVIKFVGIIPAYEAPDVDTDENSDLSDDEVVGETSHLPGRILRANAIFQCDKPDYEYVYNIVDIVGEAESEASTSKQTKPILSKVIEVESQSFTSKQLKSTVPEVVDVESQPSTSKLTKPILSKVIEVESHQNS